MTEWGLDLAEIFDPASPVLSLVNILFKTSDNRLEDLEILHQLALSKNAYNTNAEAWFLEPWSLEEQRLRPINTRLEVTVCLSANPDAMRLILPHLRPGHYQLPVRDRLSFFSFCMNDIDADSLEVVLRQDGKIRPEDVQELDQDEFPLLKLMAWRYKTELAIDGSLSPRRQKRRNLTQDIIKMMALLHCQAEPYGAYLHNISCCCFPRGTPMLSVISGPFIAIPWPQTFVEWRRMTECSLVHWMEDLEICGVDLNIYGETEKRLLLESKMSNSLCYGPNIDNCCGAIWRLENFEYGPMPRDWRFSWDLGAESFVSEFWDMVEDPPLSIIGAWPDDEEP